MRLWQRFPGLMAAGLCAVLLAACSTGIRSLNLRPELYYQQKITVHGRVMRMQVLAGDTLLEVADRAENRLLVRTTTPGSVSVGDWVKVTGVLVPEARVADTAVYDVLTAEEISVTRGPWLPEIM
jgi:hypothetical protein